MPTTSRAINGRLVTALLGIAIAIISAVIGIGAWRGAKDVEIVNLSNRVGHNEECLSDMPHEYMPRREIQAELRVIQVKQEAVETKVDLINTHTQEVLRILQEN